MFIHNRDICWGFRFAMLWYDLDLAIDLAVVTFRFKILPKLYFRNVRCRKLILCRDIDWGCRCATSWCCLDLTCDNTKVT